jgi:hypothetical protein
MSLLLVRKRYLTISSNPINHLIGMLSVLPHVNENEFLHCHIRNSYTLQQSHRYCQLRPMAIQTKYSWAGTNDG